jgi:hypothetical protein
MSEILNELRKPFHPSVVTWKPGSVKADGTKALAMAYADVRAYQQRLDDVCGMEWAVSYTPWGDRIVCHLTIHGITRSSTGEPDSQSERNEIAGTATEAQAFKRACAMFGLGRYLYNLPSVWVEYDKERRQFTAQGLAKLQAVVANHYRQATGPEGTPASPAHLEQTTQPAAASDDNGSTEIAEVAGDLRKEFDELGQQMYGAQWPQVRCHNVERISAGETSDPAKLSAEQVSRLIDGLKSLQRSRANKKVAA